MTWQRLYHGIVIYIGSMFICWRVGGCERDRHWEDFSINGPFCLFELSLFLSLFLRLCALSLFMCLIAFHLWVDLVKTNFILSQLTLCYCEEKLFEPTSINLYRLKGLSTWYLGLGTGDWRIVITSWHCLMFPVIDCSALNASNALLSRKITHFHQWSQVGMAWPNANLMRSKRKGLLLENTIWLSIVWIGSDVVDLLNLFFLHWSSSFFVLRRSSALCLTFCSSSSSQKYGSVV